MEQYLLITAAVFLVAILPTSSAACSSPTPSAAATRRLKWAGTLALPGGGRGSQLSSVSQSLPRAVGISLGMSLNNFCESWKLNVELNNLRAFDQVPSECASYVGNYMTSPQYGSDVESMTEECTLYLTFEFALSGDDKDAWIFDVDDTLLSTLPFFASHSYGAEKLNRSLLDEWKAQGKAPAVDNMISLYSRIRMAGLKIFLLSSRPEPLRNATVDNLVNAGYYGWTKLIMRSDKPDGYKTVKLYKEEERLKLTQAGYHLWGIVGDQWSSLIGQPLASPKRFFKVPNPMYYVV